MRSAAAGGGLAEEDALAPSKACPHPVDASIGASASDGGGTGLRVIGIDPGIAVCGYGVVDQPAPGSRARPLAFGVFRPKGDDAARLRCLYDQLVALLTAHRPEAAAVERVYHNRNVSTAASVGQARGVTLLALAQAGLTIAEYTPTEMKMAVAGYGGAEKRQVQVMVAAQLGLPALPTPDDAADALGLCLCHLAGEGLRGRLRASAEGMRR